jgi:co-chaperonin GroES (HSP10)
MAKKTKFDEVIILDDYILIQYEDTAVSDGGIIIPKDAQRNLDPFHEGVVVKTGEGTTERPIKVKLGDVALIPANMPRYTFTIEDKTYFLVRQTDIVLIKRKK